MPAQPVDVCRDCPLDSVLGAISHFFSDTGVVHVGAGPVLWAVSRLQLDLHTATIFFNDFRELSVVKRCIIADVVNTMGEFVRHLEELDSRRAIFYVKSPDFIIFMRCPSSSAGKINRHSIRRSMAYAARRSSKVNLSGVNGNVIIIRLRS